MSENKFYSAVAEIKASIKSVVNSAADALGEMGQSPALNDAERAFANRERLNLLICLSILEKGRVDLREQTRLVTAGRQNKSARAAGVRTGTLSDYLGGRHSIGADTLEAIINQDPPF